MKLSKVCIGQGNKNADQINKKIRVALVEAGYRGTIPASRARTITKKVLAELNIKSHKITIEPHPVHGVANEMHCDCDRSIIKVEPLPMKTG